jgi:hypothetical protein
LALTKEFLGVTHFASGESNGVDSSRWFRKRDAHWSGIESPTAAHLHDEKKMTRTLSLTAYDLTCVATSNIAARRW